jgi:uncharacterized protein YpiB (UPF0302 family)
MIVVWPTLKMVIINSIVVRYRMKRKKAGVIINPILVRYRMKRKKAAVIINPILVSM